MALVCRFWGYCSVGSAEFSAAASLAVNNAASLARTLAALFLAHFPLAVNPAAERIFRGPSVEGSPRRIEGNIRLAMPLDGALRGMHEDRDQVWVDVIELAVREWPLRHAPAFRAALAALRDHYAELGDAENLRRVTVALNAEEPWREGHRRPPVTE